MKEEIDLAILIKRIFTQLKKRWFFIVLFLAIFMFGAYQLFKKEKTIYGSEAIIFTNPESLDQVIIVKQLVVYLNKNITRNNIQNISTTLNISSDIAKNINNLTIESIDENSSSVSINIEVESTDGIEQIEKGIIDFLNKKETLAARNEIKLNKYSKINNTLDTLQQKVDSLWRAKSLEAPKTIEAALTLGKTKAENDYSMTLSSNNFGYILPFSQNKFSVIEKPNLTTYLSVAVLLAVFSFLLFISLIETVREVLK